MNQKFIESVPSKLTDGVMYIIQEYDDFQEQCNSVFNDNISSRDIHTEYIELYLLLEAYLKSKGHEFRSIDLGSESQRNTRLISDFFAYIRKEFDTIITNTTISEARDKYNILFNNTFSYEFTTGDLEKIQKLINELRDILTASELFTAEHKQRILKRLERIQQELHKKVSDLDRFWGLIGDAGVAIGKFGNDAKPIVDRIKEIADIVWRTQSRSEELPSGTTIPFLNSKNETPST